MGLFYIALFLLVVCSLRGNHGGFHSDYMGIEQCNVIKGIFILMVFLAHCMGYIQRSGYVFNTPIDKLYPVIWSEFGQLIVVMFLVYSGYGIMEQYKSGGESYLVSYPKKRILSTLLNFDVAVILFILVDVLFHIELRASQVLLSFIAWDSVGNSNWYVFDILLCYASAYIGFRLCGNRADRGLTLSSVLIVLAWILLYYAKRGQSHWYNTILCFPVGMLFSLRKEQFESIIKRHYSLILFVTILLFLFLHLAHLPSIHGLIHNIKSIAFGGIVILLTMRFRIENKLLSWFGRHLFPLYIYQRLPMIVLASLAGYNFIAAYPAVFILICFCTTVLLAAVFPFIRITIK